MNTLSEAYLNLKVGASLYELEAVQKYLSFIGKKYAFEIYGQELDIHIQIEEGSLKAWITVAGIIYAGVAGYGSFRSGIDHLVADARTFGEVVSSTFIVEANIEKEKVYRVERRLGIPGKIRRVLVKIDKLEQADYSNQMVRNELKALRAQVQSIVDELDSKKDIELFLSSLPSMYRDVQLSKPREPIAIYETVPAIRSKFYSDYQSDGSLTEFANEVHQHLQLTHKK